MSKTIQRNGFEVTKTNCPMTSGYYYITVRNLETGSVFKFEGDKESCKSFLYEVVDGIPPKKLD